MSAPDRKHWIEAPCVKALERGLVQSPFLLRTAVPPLQSAHRSECASNLAGGFERSARPGSR
jgi:hypothetical protein